MGTILSCGGIMRYAKWVNWAVVLMCGAAPMGCQNMGSLQSAIDLGVQAAGVAGYPLAGNSTAISGVKELLTLSSDRAGSYLSKADVWNVVLPESATRMVSTLRAVGFGPYVDQVESSMEVAAGLAVREAKPIFAAAVRDMNVVDALGILRGGQGAATEYFRTKTQSALRSRLQPIVQNSLKQSGYFSQYQSLMSVYNALPLASKPTLDLESYVLDKTLDGMYLKMAAEEALIRQNPSARGNALIQSALSIAR